MSKEVYLTGIDLGSATVRVVVAKRESATGQVLVMGVGESPVEGMQKGVVTDVESAVASLTRALDMAERVSGIPVERAYVSINGAHMSSQSSRGVIAVSRADGEITAEDVVRVVNAAQAISLPNNREILHVLPQDFVVDGQERIHDPVGMTGVRLEVDAHMVEGSAPFIKNVAKVVNQAGVHIEDFVFSPLAAAAAVLSKRQRELGVALVDLGSGTTSLAVYEENILLHTAVLPLGAGHITNDVAIGLRTSIDVAEAIKQQHGSALPEAVKQSERVVIEGSETGEEESVSRYEVATIIRARLDEMFSLIDRQLKNISRSGLLPAGVVLTGGGALLPGVIEVVKEKLRLPARLGKPGDFGGIAERVEGPAYAVVLGLIRWGLEQEERGSLRLALALPDIRKSVGKVRDWFKAFLP